MRTIKFLKSFRELFNSKILKKLYSKISIEHIFYAVTILFVFVFFIKTEVLYSPDSSGYLEMSIIRSCGYPLFIALHKFIFGQYFISALLLSQFTINIIASLFLIKCIRKTLQLSKWFLFLLFILLLTPLLYEIKVANSILSESLAYPLYLIIVGNILIAVIKKQHFNFYYGFALSPIFYY